MLKRTFLSREKKRASGFKAAKDRLTLLLGGNASGDFKLKPLLVYHSISKSTLPVIWESNNRSWITMKIFQYWSVDVVFLPPNTTALIQPMDQGVISNFKAFKALRNI